jgi:hypothetical protein
MRKELHWIDQLESFTNAPRTVVLHFLWAGTAGVVSDTLKCRSGGAYAGFEMQMWVERVSGIADGVQYLAKVI